MVETIILFSPISRHGCTCCLILCCTSSPTSTFTSSTYISSLFLSLYKISKLFLLAYFTPSYYDGRQIGRAYRPYLGLRLRLRLLVSILLYTALCYKIIYDTILYYYIGTHTARSLNLALTSFLPSFFPAIAIFVPAFLFRPRPFSGFLFFFLYFFSTCTFLFLSFFSFFPVLLFYLSLFSFLFLHLLFSDPIYLVSSRFVLCWVVSSCQGLKIDGLMNGKMNGWVIGWIDG